jgi:L-malate glycosyltransferase
MRILVYPHDLTIGGSQINAIDLAAEVAAAGHEVIVYGIPGPLVDYIKERGLRFIPARPLKYRPAPSRILQLARIATQERIDLIHAYEWAPCLDAYYGAGFLLSVPVLCTVLSMSVMPYVPTRVPLIMGTANLGRQASKIQRADVWVLEPPIDVLRDHPGVDGSIFRQAHGIETNDLLVVSVSRVALDLKIDALVRAIDAVDLLAGKYPLKLIIVGGGPAHDTLLERARIVNARWKRQVISLPGPVSDPRSAYAAADVVVGMGSSALRGLAIGRPVVVQGEAAFSEVFEPATLNMFLQQGFYGIADSETGATRLAAQIDRLLSNAAYREAIGNFGRDIVVQRFSLERAARIQLDIYHDVLANPPQRSVTDAIRSAYLAFMLEVRNHDPRQKAKWKSWEATTLATARDGAWPPLSGQNG